MTWKSLTSAALLTALAGFGTDWMMRSPSIADLLQQPRRGTLVSTKDMRVARAGHTATALPDGRVLVAGGFKEKGSASGAEVYQPDSGQFSPLPPMITPRYGHTATFLPDGRVLIAGGYGEGSGMLADVELFDPANNSFTRTGSLLAARAGHVAVLLKNGQVLVAGGVGPGWTFLASAEVYDPEAGRFLPAGQMSMPREGHAGVRLLDGRVFIVGGHNGQRRNLTLLAAAEIYDPGRAAFVRAGAMRTPRHKHDAVLLPNGQVLIAGGTDERDARGVFSSTELFSPDTGMFVNGPVMKFGRYQHQGTSVLLPGGLVLIAGGAPQAEIYDPARRSFVLVPGRPQMAGHFSAVAMLRGGGVLITGGYGNGTAPRSSAWLFLPYESNTGGDPSAAFLAALEQSLAHQTGKAPGIERAGNRGRKGGESRNRDREIFAGQAEPAVGRASPHLLAVQPPLPVVVETNH